MQLKSKIIWTLNQLFWNLMYISNDIGISQHHYRRMSNFIMYLSFSQYFFIINQTLLLKSS